VDKIKNLKRNATRSKRARKGKERSLKRFLYSWSFPKQKNNKWPSRKPGEATSGTLGEGRLRTIHDLILPASFFGQTTKEKSWPACEKRTKGREPRKKMEKGLTSECERKESSRLWFHLSEKDKSGRQRVLRKIGCLPPIPQTHDRGDKKNEKEESR